MSAILDILRSFWRLFIWWTVVQPWEQGIRVRLGKHRTRLAPGLCFRIPYADTIYRQSVRLRYTSMYPQTVTTADGQTLTIAGVLGYSITDMDLLYDTLHQAEDALRAMVQGEVATAIHHRTLAECRPADVEKEAGESLNLARFGLAFESMRLTTFACVRTFRLIQDSHYGVYEDPLNTRNPDQAPAGAPR